jgi:hypothetical protein
MAAVMVSVTVAATAVVTEEVPAACSRVSERPSLIIMPAATAAVTVAATVVVTVAATAVSAAATAVVTVAAMAEATAAA